MEPKNDIFSKLDKLEISTKLLRRRRSPNGSMVEMLMPYIERITALRQEGVTARDMIPIFNEGGFSFKSPEQFCKTVTRAKEKLAKLKRIEQIISEPINPTSTATLTANAPTKSAVNTVTSTPTKSTATAQAKTTKPKYVAPTPVDELDVSLAMEKAQAIYKERLFLPSYWEKLPEEKKLDHITGAHAFLVRSGPRATDPDNFESRSYDYSDECAEHIRKTDYTKARCYRNGNPPGNQYPSEVEFSPNRIEEVLRENIAFFRQPNHRHSQAGRSWQPGS